MATNIDITTGEDSVVLYFQDMTTMTIEAHTMKSIQLVDNGFVTISETINAEDGEHPPPGSFEDVTGVSPEEWFYERMVRFWQAFKDMVQKDMIKDDIENAPKPTPYKE
jgi:hypothetical protein